MSKLIKNQKIGFLAVLIILLGLCGPLFADEIDLPKNMVWSCYDVGSSGYVQASAVANAFLKKYDIRVRLMPSGTSIGRLMPLAKNRSDVAFLGNEAFFSSTGEYDFSTYQWGPQDIRAVLGVPTSYIMIVTKESGLKEIKDLKGKRVSWVVGNPSVNVKCTAILAYGNLTWNDVEKIDFPSYSDSLKALILGSTDATGGSPTASIYYELESSKKGIYHLQMPPENVEGWKRVQEIAPFVFPFQETVGAGISKEKPVWGLGYKYPVVTVRTDADPKFVKNLIKAFEETYPLYKDAASSLPAWDLRLSSDIPIDIPYHEGAIQYLKEKGYWDDNKQKWNDERIEYLNKVKELWKKSVAEAKAKKIDEKEFSKQWGKTIELLKN
ncbi:MAG TPA: C4-dicarboxylate ABC transporter substrate-binding protein [Candidatus Atribacteria bacterium]|nr:C4-dicarboxylate ABC transporter substrate-binding protein [Candidatus Atribacteria bacterium]